MSAIRGSVLAAMALLALPASAQSITTISYPPDHAKLVVTMDPNPTAGIFEELEYTSQFGGEYDISTTGELDSVPSGCVDNDGSDAAPRKSLDCTPVPEITEVTGSPGIDYIRSNCLFGSPDGTGFSALTLHAGAGNDQVTNGIFCEGTKGELGDGDDTYSGSLLTPTFGGSPDVISAGNGDDTLRAMTGPDELKGDAGNDTIEGSGLLEGGDGNDEIAGSGTLKGDEGRDKLDASDTETDDTLSGGAGRDLLIPGTGKDVVDGGDGLDTASYEDRPADVTLALSLNGAADDGAAGEQDQLQVENIIGGPGPDTITGDAGANSLEGSLGGDSIDGGAGSDILDGGEGNDVVRARDGAQDNVDCAAGDDTAIVDEFDTTANCEIVQSSRELMSDVDNDGLAAPADCDDRNPARRPGLPDRPGNGVDEDCKDADAPFPRVLTGVSATYNFTKKYTRFTKLVALDVPPEGTVEVRCIGGKKRGCFTNVIRHAFAKGTVEDNLTKLVRKAKLKPKAVLMVSITRPDTIGKIVLRTVRANKAPTSTILCLTPGVAAPAKC